jgi:hypothetical protein
MMRLEEEGWRYPKVRRLRNRGFGSGSPSESSEESQMLYKRLRVEAPRRAGGRTWLEEGCPGERQRAYYRGNDYGHLTSCDPVSAWGNSARVCDFFRVESSMSRSPGKLMRLGVLVSCHLLFCGRRTRESFCRRHALWPFTRSIDGYDE